MTGPEKFVSRWARLKREVASIRKTETEAKAPQPEAAAAPDTDTALLAQHGNDGVADEAFDLAKLPSIESITADTDIRAFLRGRVPGELTRVALRRAWASDPAIRDFIGIAESQWDFNDPNAIPGFGPLPGSDNLPGLLGQALGGCDTLTETFAELPLSGEQALSAATAHEPTGLDRSAQRTLDESPAVDAHIGGPPVDGRKEGAAIGSDRAAERIDASPNRRKHGSALPRFEV
jgi:Protein of unknown function (DUF3306)